MCPFNTPPPGLRAPQAVSKAEPNHPTAATYFAYLYSHGLSLSVRWLFEHR